MKRGNSTFRALPLLFVLSIAIPRVSAAQKDGAQHWQLQQEGNKQWFCFDYSIIGRDMLIITRLKKGSSVSPHEGYNGYGGHGGDKCATLLVRWDTLPGQRLALTSPATKELSADTGVNGLARAVGNSSLSPLEYIFPIEPGKLPNLPCRIDLSGLFTSDGPLFFDETARKSLQLSSYDPARSSIVGLRTWDNGFALDCARSYQCAGGGLATFLTTTNFLLLPPKPMRRRMRDARVGYFSLPVTDYDANPQGIAARAIVTRWRLEPAPADTAAYYRGVLVEPAQPIVFFIDRATPAKWVPYFIQGVEDWNAAFEEAGFKHAIRARLAPARDESPDGSIADSRNAVIVYQASPTKDASYSTTIDPRTGEILESHIKWYHNVISLLHDWYFVQASPNDKAGRHGLFNDSLMGKLIRYICAHEIGHALGLGHNFGASSAYPTDSLRSAHWLQIHGFCPSIMDYARFNYIAQPEDRIDPALLLPRINAYDRWAIKWGYTVFPGNLPDNAVSDTLARWTTKMTAQPMYRFGDGDHPPITDPRVQPEDLGDDALLAVRYGMKNLRRVAGHMMEWLDTGPLADSALPDLYQAIVDQYTWYLQHCTALIGGRYDGFKGADPSKEHSYYVSAQKQKAALRLIDSFFFSTPGWLLDSALLHKTGRSSLAVLDDIGTIIFSQLMDPARWAILLEAQQSSNAYTLDSLLQDLQQYIYKELPLAVPASLARRQLQTAYAHILYASLHKAEKPWRDLTDLAISKAIVRLQQLIEQARKQAGTGDRREYLQFLGAIR